MDPLHERQLSSSAAGPSHAEDGPGTQSGGFDGSQYGGLSFVSVSSPDLLTQTKAAACAVNRTVNGRFC